MMHMGGVPMLKSFTLRNAFSFVDEQKLDMEATKIKAHSYSLLTSESNSNIPPGIDILPVMSIYGANASGKSNLIRSLHFVLQSIASGSNHSMLPFMLGDFTNDKLFEPPFFELTFLLDKTEYNLAINSFADAFFREELSYRENSKGRFKRIYLREWNKETSRWKLDPGSTIDSHLAEEVKYVHKMEKNNQSMLLYALCNRGNHNHFKAISKWTSCFSTAQNIAGDITTGGILTTHEANPYLTYYNESASKKRILGFLQSMNPSIQNYTLAKKDDSAKSNKSEYRLVFEYSKAKNRTVEDENVDIDKMISKYESRGVSSAFVFLPSMLMALESGGLIVVDELENSLHPLLMAKVVNMFTDPDVNVGGGQLIFTTHNVFIMDKKYLRQDEIVFVEKDYDGKSEIYKLSDIDGARSDLDFCKNYILGAFGAVPKL